MRVTVACPAAFVSDAAELAMALGFSVADRRTYDQVQFEDAAGNRYACASAMVSDSFVARAMSRLGRPVWDGGRAVNMTGAARAQAMIALIGPKDDPAARPDRITAIAGDDGLAAIRAMGLTAISEEGGK
ncbi:MAG: hypothetical protein R3D85_16350 [Paracoccaceae bacterium]|nr:hypothetical protein [Paracoccaceae bacterium]MCB2132348.1 hypothetical protein [Paracoccaceae bacterium]MCB2138099.1 hypothetical protein [Paracoccaceae bacterium]MCB2159935.1 hypothetical protein [Paracoccaceae bacterium]